MKIYSEGIKILIRIFEDDEINYEDSIEFTKTKAMKAFIKHEKSFGKNISRNIITEELIKLKIDNGYKDNYSFYILKENISLVKKEILYMEENEDKIIKGALDKVYDFIPKDIKIQSNIHLYAGGIDGGFTVSRKDIFINYIKYFNNLDEFVKVISHELFHCRLISLNNKLKNTFIDNINNKYIYEILGMILEEGIACLIQHGIILGEDDPAETLTKAKMNKIDKKLEQLNNILFEIKDGNIDHSMLKTLDIYTIGYHIASSLYGFYGREVLLPWIENYNYKEMIKSYIEVTREKGQNSGFTKEVEKWLLQI